MRRRKFPPPPQTPFGKVWFNVRNHQTGQRQTILVDESEVQDNRRNKMMAYDALPKERRDQLKEDLNG